MSLIAEPSGWIARQAASRVIPLLDLLDRVGELAQTRIARVQEAHDCMPANTTAPTLHLRNVGGVNVEASGQLVLRQLRVLTQDLESLAERLLVIGRVSQLSTFSHVGLSWQRPKHSAPAPLARPGAWHRRPKLRHAGHDTRQVFVAASLEQVASVPPTKEELKMSAVAVSDVQVLAAIERATRHSPNKALAVPKWEVTAHLAIPRRSRRIIGQLDVLELRGFVERSRITGVTVWSLTSDGRRRLQRLRRAGKVPALPESPQHRAWRDAQAAAEQHIEAFERDVYGCLNEARQLLDTEQPVCSDAWFAIAERVKRACRRLASAIYCLREWREPDDARADIDDRSDPSDERYDAAEQARRRSRRVSRRNFWHWSQSPLTEAE